MARWRGLARIIGLLALAAALSACSAIKLGYNNLDDLAYWWLDGYLDFNDEQAARVREDLDRLHLWHRTQELPRVASMLKEMEALAPGEITAAQACRFVAQARERLDAVADRADPAVVTLATSLTPEQLAHLARKYQKNDAEFRKKWIEAPAAEREERRLEQFVERSEMIYGRLDEPQRAVLRAQLASSKFDAKRFLALRERRQRDILDTLRKVAGQPGALSEARQSLRGLFDRLREPPLADDRDYVKAVTDEGCAQFAALHNSTSAAQREAAVRRLRAYQRDLQELAGQR